MLSWLTLFAAALAIWFVLKSSAATMPSWILRACRVVIAFFLYSGFLYLLKWNPLWKLLSVSPESRNRVEGFLILICTLIWLVAILRILFRGFRFPSFRSGSKGLECHTPRPEKIWPFIKKVAIFHYFLTRK